MKKTRLLISFACLGFAGQAAAAPLMSQPSTKWCGNAVSTHASQLELAGAAGEPAMAAHTDIRLVVGAADPVGLVIKACPAAARIRHIRPNVSKHSNT